VGGKKILIIDDEEDIRKIMRRVLEKAGCEVLDAPNGKEGLHIYHQTFPDLVITDILMPEMDGLEVIMALRQEHPGAKIMAISGGGQCGHNYLPISLKLGAVHTIAKPFRQRELLSAVFALLENDSGKQPG
jgi:CheY-like chemotaxis protein